MPKLIKTGDGGYRGEHKGQPFTVRKEEVPREHVRSVYGTFSVEGHSYVWVARHETFEAHSSTREGAVRRLGQQLDEAALDLPELDALLKRWAERIKALVPYLDKRNLTVTDDMLALQHQMNWVDKAMRGYARRFEEELARLEAKVSVAASKQIG